MKHDHPVYEAAYAIAVAKSMGVEPSSKTITYFMLQVAALAEDVQADSMREILLSAGRSYTRARAEHTGQAVDVAKVLARPYPEPERVRQGTRLLNRVAPVRPEEKEEETRKYVELCAGVLHALRLAGDVEPMDEMFFMIRSPARIVAEADSH